MITQYMAEPEDLSKWQRMSEYWDGAYENDEWGFPLFFSFSMHIVFAIYIWKRIPELQSQRATTFCEWALWVDFLGTVVLLFLIFRIRFFRKNASPLLSAVWTLSMATLFITTFRMNALEDSYKVGRLEWRMLEEERVLPENLLFCFLDKRSCPSDYAARFPSEVARLRSSLHRDVELDAFHRNFKTNVARWNRTEFKMPDRPQMDPGPADQFLDSLDKSLEYLEANPTTHQLLHGRIRFRAEHERSEFQKWVHAAVQSYWRLQATRPNAGTPSDESNCSLPMQLEHNPFPSCFPLPRWFFKD